MPAQPGQRVRVRVTNTDNGPMKVWTSAPYRLARCGRHRRAPTHRGLRPVGDAHRRRPGRSRGESARRRHRGQGATVQGDRGRHWSRRAPMRRVPPQPAAELDLLSLRHAGPTRLRSGPTHPPVRVSDRSAARLRKRPARHVVVHQRPALPACPDVCGARGRRGGDAHREPQRRSASDAPSRPSRGRAGSQWCGGHRKPVVGRLAQRLPGETYDIAFVANNPGIWMDHCHNLKHAAQGMIAHLMYEGFDTPYRIAGPADNQPE